MIFNFSSPMGLHIMEFHRRCYSNQLVSDRYAMPDYFIQPGHLCCVRISEDKWWYRVIIHRVLGKQEVEVFYPDFGNIGTVQKSSLRFLKWVDKFNKHSLSFGSYRWSSAGLGSLFFSLAFLPLSPPPFHPSFFFVQTWQTVIWFHSWTIICCVFFHVTVNLNGLWD